MNVVDRGKYVSSILIVFAMGVILNLALEQRLWLGAHSLAGLWNAIKNIRVDEAGLSQTWKFVASGGTFAGIYVWLFEKYGWKWPLFQGWFVRFHNLSGTWLGILEPRTRSMRPGVITESERRRKQRGQSDQ